MPYQIKTFQDGDLALSYETFGRGDHVLVYLHGLLLDTVSNRRLAQDLADAGNRVILVDLPGHGASGKPRRAAGHRMDAYAAQVLRLLDHLEIERAVVGGMSLGANVTLMVALSAPERLAGMVLEMPVLESATPVAAMLFVPVLAATHYAAPVLRAISAAARRVPRARLGPLGPVFAPLLLEPEEVVAILHGVLVGPVAPTSEQRAAMAIPSVVVGHRADRLHPLDDARRLARELPQARLLEARSVFELRLNPERLTAEIATFLDEVWSAESARHRHSA